MNKDPNRSEMLATIKLAAEAMEIPFHNDQVLEQEWCVEEAMYWFANRYHVGQNSNLYAFLSTTKYKPSKLSNGPESVEGMSVYEELIKAAFPNAPKRLKNNQIKLAAKAYAALKAFDAIDADGAVEGVQDGTDGRRKAALRLVAAIFQLMELEEVDFAEEMEADQANGPMLTLEQAAQNRSEDLTDGEDILREMLDYTGLKLVEEIQ